jgi:phage terminase small subunit
MSEPDTPLTDRKLAFCRHVVAGDTPTQAGIKTQYSKAQSFRIRRDPLIQAEIERLRTEAQLAVMADIKEISLMAIEILKQDMKAEGMGSGKIRRQAAHVVAKHILGPLLRQQPQKEAGELIEILNDNDTINAPGQSFAD